jgi:CNT family concentrative nucleoside transporter
MNAKILIGVGIVGLTVLTYLTQGIIGPRGQSVIGIVVFLSIALLCSANLKAINRRVVLTGLGLQLILALLILKVPFVRAGFDELGKGVQQFLDFSIEGANFVYGPLTNAPTGSPVQNAAGLVGGGYVDSTMSERFPGKPFYFFFRALPTVIFVSAFFTILYFLGVLQLIVWAFSKLMLLLMGKQGVSGAETLSATANVFMGQTEAPLIVKPWIPRMTRSELLALMIGGMATISGGLIAVYINMGANAVAILATSVMAAPTGLYLSKMLLPEAEEPETRGELKLNTEKPHNNIVEAAASGASDGMSLVLNIAAMLIAFIALIAMVNFLLGLISPGLSLQAIFAVLFSPLAMLMGVGGSDIPRVGELLGTKLVLNEFVAYADLTTKYITMDQRSFILATFALTGFANFASIGIQLGGIGPMTKRMVNGREEDRRGELAKLGGRALLGGFLATLINAAIAGVLI